ncbi:GPP34 family phosphoprotein [Nonomuraea sp. NPDC000554]|uniref:GOLPH3/VPS74 family protein n=1 Tax=Nonomuraea sp. NPDC000554 TaxID=3154259 RepID=UPI0033348336
MSTAQLTIAEELVLLAHREHDGKPLISNMILDIGLIAADLAELAERGKVRLSGRDLVVADQGPVGDPELDAVLARMVKVGKALPPRRWLDKVNPMGRRKRYLQRLSERGALSAEKRRILGLFPVERYPEADPTLEREIRDRLGKALRGRQPDSRTVALLAVAHRSGLTKQLFAPSTTKRIEELIDKDWAGKAVKAYVDESNGSVAVVAAAAT